MDARSGFRLKSGLLGALLAAAGGMGCATLGGGIPTDPPAPPPAVGKPYPGPAAVAPAAVAPAAPGPAAAAFPGGTVVATGGAAVAAAGADGQGDPLPQPRPVPPGGVPGGPGGPSAPPVGSPRAAPGAPVAATDPHRRPVPTVTGGALELAPWEVPADRVVELSKQLELAHAQNHDLIARIKELEMLGFGREQALAEAMREVEALTPEAAKARVLQAQVAILQERIRTLEAEDISLLRAVLDVLKSLFPEVK